MNPQEVPFIDIHTHQGDRQLSLQAIAKQPICCGYSYAIHPWKVKDSNLTLLQALLEENKLAAIGETGLDRAHPDTYDLQREVFERHIILAEQYRKPLIIHNVRATADILSLHKKYQPKQAWILHGFNGNAQEIQRLTERGVFLSIGESIFYPNRKIAQSISSIPREFLFLETDTSEKTIQQVYERVSELLNLPLFQLKEQIFANFARLNLTPWKIGNNAHDCSSATMALINLDEAMCS